jgi:hypothetical protein
MQIHIAQGKPEVAVAWLMLMDPMSVQLKEFETLLLAIVCTSCDTNFDSSSCDISPSQARGYVLCSSQSEMFCNWPGEEHPPVRLHLLNFCLTFCMTLYQISMPMNQTTGSSNPVHNIVHASRFISLRRRAP